MTSSTQWIWVWANSGRWRRTGEPGVLQSMGSQSQTQLSDWRITTQQIRLGWRAEGRGGRICHQNCPRDWEREREKGTEAGWWPGFLQGETDYITAYVFWNLKGASLPTWETGVSEVTEYMLKQSGVFFFPSPSVFPFFMGSLFQRIWVSEESLEIIRLNLLPHAEISFMMFTTDGHPLSCCFCYDLFSSVISFYRTPLR